MHMNKSNLHLKGQYEELLGQISKEHDLCANLDRCIRTGSVNPKSLKSILDYANYRASADSEYGKPAYQI
jgi:hypothetical protein